MIEIFLLDGLLKFFLSELSEFMFCLYYDFIFFFEFICKSYMSIYNSDLFFEIII